MIAHLSYVLCDFCGNPGPCGDDAQEARAEATAAGYTRENGKDRCPSCTPSPFGDLAVAR